MRKLDRTLIARLSTRYDYNVHKVAAKMKCSPNTIYRIWHDEFGRRVKPKPVIKIDRARLEALTEQWGFGAAARIADEFGVHVDSIHRIWRDEYGHRRRTYVTPEQQRRIDVLAREGLPSTWIAEDVGLGSWVVRDHRPKDAPFDFHEWTRTWAAVRNDDDLLRIHRSVAPKSTKQLEAESVLDRMAA